MPCCFTLLHPTHFKLFPHICRADNSQLINLSASLEASQGVKWLHGGKKLVVITPGACSVDPQIPENSGVEAATSDHEF